MRTAFKCCKVLMLSRDCVPMWLFVYSMPVHVVGCRIAVKPDVGVVATLVLMLRVPVHDRHALVLMLLAAIVGMCAIFAGRARAVLVGVIHGVIASTVIMGVS